MRLEMLERPRWQMLIMTLMMLGLIACGAQPAADPDEPAGAEGRGEEAAGAPVVLDLWIFEGEEAFLPRLEEEFEAQNENIDLQITEIPESEYAVKVDTALAANEPPDIGFVLEPRWVKAGQMVDLTGMMEAEGIALEDYNTAALGYECLPDDGETGVYCLGSYTGAVVLFYNKDLFDAAGVPFPSPTEPMTIAEYKEIACDLTQASENLEEQVWGGVAEAMIWWTDPRYAFSEDGRTVQVTNPDVVQAYQDLADMVSEGCAPSYSDYDLVGDVDMMTQGMQATGILDNIYGVELFEEAGMNYGVAPVPVVNEGDPVWVSSWTDRFGVFSQSDDVEAAQQFITFLATDGNRLRAEVGGIPLITEMADEMDWAADNEGRQELLQTIELARPPVFVPNWWGVVDPIWDAFDLMLEGEMTAEEALAEASTYMEENLEQAWETWESVE